MGFRPSFARHGTDTDISAPNNYELQEAMKPSNNAHVHVSEKLPYDTVHGRLQETNADAEYSGRDYTYTDQQDMHRMGKVRYPSV